MLDINGNKHSIHRGDRIISVSGIEYANLYIDEIFPLAHDARRKPTRVIHGKTDVHIIPVDRGHDANQNEFDEFWGQASDQQGNPEDIKYTSGFMMNGQIHWSRSGKIDMSNNGDNNNAMGWVTVENPISESFHKMYRLRFESRDRG